MRYHLVTALIGAIAAFGAMALAEPPTPTACVEDMPCWDCNTMGNKVCGPQNEGIK